MDAQEIWREVPSLPGWMASSYGRVKRPESFAMMPAGNIRKYKTKPTFGYEEKVATGRSDSKKRMIVGSRNAGTQKVHQLVCEAFHGPKPAPHMIVLHEDEDASNNRPENLRWGTRKENQNFPKVQQAFRSRTGENSPTNIYRKRKSDDPNYKSRIGGK